MRLFQYGALLLLIGACGTAGEPGAETTTTTGGTPSTVETTTTSEVPTPVALPEGFPVSLLDEIVEDAARSTDVPMSNIEVTSVEAHTFNDASLGCPEPGQMYAQVITPGFIVLVEAGGAELDYRVAKDSSRFVGCGPD